MFVPLAGFPFVSHTRAMIRSRHRGRFSSVVDFMAVLTTAFLLSFFFLFFFFFLLAVCYDTENLSLKATEQEEEKKTCYDKFSTLFCCLKNK